MTRHSLSNHFLMCVIIIIIALGFAFALPNVSSSQGFAAQREISTRSNPPEVLRYYVAKTGDNSDPTGGWDTAYRSLQDAILLASFSNSRVEIWVAKGIYYPDVGGWETNNSPLSTFHLLHNITLYGGFDTDDAVFSDRDWVKNLTILSGDIDKNDDTDNNGVVADTDNINGNNAYHVVTADGTVGTKIKDDAVLVGFTITAGHGGAIYNNAGDGTSQTILRNSILYKNQDSNGTSTLTASIFNRDAAVRIYNSLVQGSGGSESWTPDVTFIDEGGNIDTNPLFVEPIDPGTAPGSNGNLRVLFGSPAINAGKNSYVTVSTDLDNNPRIVSSIVDMGAYEALLNGFLPLIIH